MSFHEKTIASATGWTACARVLSAYRPRVRKSNAQVADFIKGGERVALLAVEGGDTGDGLCRVQTDPVIPDATYAPRAMNAQNERLHRALGLQVVLTCATGLTTRSAW